MIYCCTHTEGKTKATEKTQITQDQMFEYGYKNNDMIPVSAEEAIRYFEADAATVYLLYSDDTEAEAESRAEISEFDGCGMFGLNKIQYDRISQKKAV